jgi:general stress protein YciG
MSIDEKTPTTTPTEQTPTNASMPNTQASPTTTNSAAEDGGTPHEQPSRPRRRGFAAMDRDRVKEIASKGGRAAHAAGTAHQFSADEARVAGKKGGLAPHVRRGGVRRRPISEAAAPNSQQGQVDGR